MVYVVRATSRCVRDAVQKSGNYDGTARALGNLALNNPGRVSRQERNHSDAGQLEKVQMECVTLESGRRSTVALDRRYRALVGNRLI